MKLFVFMRRTGAIVCLGVVAEDYRDALKVIDPDSRKDIYNKKYPLKLEKEFELKGGTRGVAFSIEE